MTFVAKPDDLRRKLLQALSNETGTDAAHIDPIKEAPVAEPTAQDIESQVAAAVAAATAELKVELAEKDAQIAELKNDAQGVAQTAEVASLQKELDVALANVKAAEERAVAAEQKNADVEAFLASEAEKAAVRDDRVAKVRELDALSDERIEARADDWAAMSEEAFEAQLEDLKAIRPAVKAGAETTLPKQTALTAAAEPFKGREHANKVLAEARSRGINTALV